MTTHLSYSPLGSSQGELNGNSNNPDQHTPNSAIPESQNGHNTVELETPEIKASTDKAKFDWGGSWIWEIGGGVLSVICIALLIAFLAYVHGTPYADWQYTASPNTVVSIIVTIAKAALLAPVSACLSQLKWNRYRTSAPLYHMQAIDQASRGTMGSLEVLWRAISGSRMGNLTLFGALITVVALAIDPFAQQILAFPSRTVPAENGIVSVQRAQEYASMDGQWADSMYYGLPPSMLVSILSGLAQTNTPLEPKCGSGNCKYPEFVTLGICSQCEDVTSRTNQTCQPLDDSAFLKPDSSVYKEIPVNCTYTSPSGFILNLSLDDVSNGGYSGAIETFDLNYWSSITRNGSMFGINSPITSFIAANYSLEITYVPENTTVPLTKPSLTECTVYYCEKQYPPSIYLATDQKGHSSHPSNTQQLIPKDARANDKDYSLKDVVHLGPPNATETLSQNSSYSIDHYTFTCLKDMLGNLLNTTLFTPGTDPTKDGLNMATILRTSNLSQSLTSMSNSITDNIRVNSKATTVPGNAFRYETFIHVRWPWIILPICAVLGSILLLLGTALANKRQDTVLWKSSILPLMISQLDTRPDHGIASIRHVDEVQDISKKIHVTLEENGGPLVFTEK